MKKKTNQQLARAIATQLFSCSDQKQATRIALRRTVNEADPLGPETDHGGLCKAAAINRILKVLDKHQPNS